jgi:hypothetical protein
MLKLEGQLVVRHTLECLPTAINSSARQVTVLADQNLEALSAITGRTKHLTTRVEPRQA